MTQPTQRPACYSCMFRTTVDELNEHVCKRTGETISVERADGRLTSLVKGRCGVVGRFFVPIRPL